MEILIWCAAAALAATGAFGLTFQSFTANTEIFMVLGNWRFVMLLVIFSGFWVVFWQQYISLPIYVRTYVDPNANLSHT